MTQRVSRRHFLALSLPFFVTGGPPLALGAGGRATRLERGYQADVGVLFDLLHFSVTARITEEVDLDGGWYRVTVAADGAGVEGRGVSTGVVRGGRFVPRESVSSGLVRGREHRGHITYDLDARAVRYRSVSHTLLLGRRREVDDTVAIPPGVHVDDLVSAQLNFAADRLERDGDGAHRVTVVRRARAEDEGVDDVAAGYRAELRTLRFRPSPEPNTRRQLAQVDLTGFSAWARAGRPAEVAFGPDRRLESVRSSLILGTTFTLRLDSAS